MSRASGSEQSLRMETSRECEQYVLRYPCFPLNVPAADGRRMLLLERSALAEDEGGLLSEAAGGSPSVEAGSVQVAAPGVVDRVAVAVPKVAWKNAGWAVGARWKCCVPNSRTPDVVMQGERVSALEEVALWRRKRSPFLGGRNR